MIVKRIQDLTPEEKQRFYEAVKADYIRKYDTPWDVIEKRIQKDIDDSFDDSRFVKMDPDFQIDAAYLRKEFGKNKPSIVDYMLWSCKFVTHSDYVSIPDK